MGRMNKPTCLEKRDLLNQAAVSLDTLTGIGESFEQSDYVYDAADFYQKANAREGLSRLLESSREEGNVFLFKRICRILGHEPSREEWMALARRAEALGKLTFAAEAYSQAGEPMVSEQSESHHGSSS